MEYNEGSGEKDDDDGTLKGRTAVYNPSQRREAGVIALFQTAKNMFTNAQIAVPPAILMFHRGSS